MLWEETALNEQKEEEKQEKQEKEQEKSGRGEGGTMQRKKEEP